MLRFPYYILFLILLGCKSESPPIKLNKEETLQIQIYQQLFKHFHIEHQNPVFCIDTTERAFLDGLTWECCNSDKHYQTIKEIALENSIQTNSILNCKLELQADKKGIPYYKNMEVYNLKLHYKNKEVYTLYSDTLFRPNHFNGVIFEQVDSTLVISYLLFNKDRRAGQQATDSLRADEQQKFRTALEDHIQHSDSPIPVLKKYWALEMNGLK